MGLGIPLGGGGGSATEVVVWKQEAGSTAPAAAANTKRGFLDSENNDFLTVIDENGVLEVLDEWEMGSGILTPKPELNYNSIEIKVPTGASPELLIQSETTNGSTTFTDSVGAHTVTPTGDTQHSTAQAKFGSSSMLFDGTGDYLTIPNSADFQFGSGDFTIEMWLYETTRTSNSNILSVYGASQVGFSLYCVNGVLQFGYSLDGTTFIYIYGATAITLNTWTHVALVRNGNTISLYIDGVLDQSVAETGTLHASTAPLYVSWNTATAYWDGYMEEIAIYKGSAKYTAGFTPPTSPITLLGNSIRLQRAGEIEMVLDGVVRGDFDGTGLALLDSSSTTQASFSSDGTTDSFINSNLGIGTDTPAKPLNIDDGVGNGDMRLGGVAGCDIIHNNIGDTTLDIKQLYAATSAAAQMRLTSGFTTFHTGTSGTEKMRILSTGGLTFNGDTSTANALDDYEEGTFTPALANIGTGTYATQSGTYTKIGNVCTVQIHVGMATLGTASGQVQVTGLPYSSSNVTDNYGLSSSIYGSFWNTARSDLTSLLSPNTSTITLYYDSGSASAAGLDHASLGGDGQLIFSMTYRTV